MATRRRKGKRKRKEPTAEQREQWAKERAERVQGAFDKLHEGIDDYLSSDAWKNFLKTQAAWISKYSWNNCLLIKLQRGDASLVFGYKEWRKHGRHVLKRPEDLPDDEPWGMTIIAPLKWSRKVEDPATGEETRIGGIRGWTTATVYDIKQTGILPGCEDTAMMPQDICEDIEGDEAGLWDRLMAFAEHKGIPVHRSSAAEAYYVPRKHEVTVGKYTSRAMEAMAFAHELGHALFRHGGADCKLSRDVKELEAQSVAYIVCAHYGIEADQFSFEYLGSWAKDDALKVLEKSGKRIRDMAREIVEYTEADAKSETLAA